ncbi:PelD GGDEF domain-containing protein [Paraburkholderia heleia]|uniref:PelD GGDEF domain-containing protein n=1 Tax=Paraburkholderia heleia TaxID=634127 RepID=UPI000694EDD9|nr:PelD GGDEF domain-containing protein [Paraburkholderia heleia]
MDVQINHGRDPATRERGTGRRHLYERPHSDPGWLRNLLAPVTRSRFAWLEAALVTIAALALAWFVDRTDPLLLKSGFPWPWLVPTLIALRYGVAPGLGSGLLLAALWLLAYPAGMPWPTPFFVGGGVLVILAGHFADTWNVRADRANAVNDYLNERLTALTDNHYLLRLSHERLERDLLTRPTTLRDSINELRQLSGGTAADASAAASGLPGTTRLIEFVARACQIEVAALCPVRGGQLVPEALASAGEPFELDAGDPLIALALSSGQLAHLKSADMLASGSRYIACAPLIAATGETRALLVVQRMPFLSLTHDNLQLLFVLLGYYGDGLEYARATRELMDAVPNCPSDFGLEYGRLVRLHQRSGIESSVVALSFPRSEAHDSLFEHVLRRGRSADLAWSLQTAQRSVLVNLMPLADTTGVAGYLARIETNLRNQFDTDFERARVGVHTLHVTGASSKTNLVDLLQRVTTHE